MKYLFIINPVSGYKAFDISKDILSWSKKNKVEINIQKTEGKNDAKTYATEAKMNGFDTVIACGGDGTINEILNGIIGQDIRLGIIPIGTGNLVARKLKIPFDLERALLSLSKGKTISLDVGEILEQQHFFLIESGVGMEADIAKDELITKKRLFHLPLHLDYSWKILNHIYNFNKRNVEIEMDNKRIITDFLNISCSNLSYVDIDHLLNLQVNPFDGKLDVIISNPESRFGAILNLFRLRFHQDFRSNNHYKTKCIVIKTPKLLLQADGELVGETPATIQIAKFKQKIIVPN